MFSSEVAAAWTGVFVALIGAYIVGCISILALFVAAAQLETSNRQREDAIRAERTKTTLEQMQLYFGSQQQVQDNEPITAQVGLDNIHTVSESRRLTENFMGAWRQHESGIPFEKAAEKLFLQRAAWFVISLNYFGTIASFFKRRLLLEELFLAKFCRQITQLADFCEKVADAVPPARTYLNDPENAALTALARIEFARQQAAGIA